MASLPSAATTRIADTVVIGTHTILAFLEGPSSFPILSYDTITNSWSKRPDPGLPLGDIGTDDSFALATDGFVYRTSGATQTAVFRYDPTGNAWQSDRIALLGDVWASDAVALDDGTILLVGGGSTATSLVWFDPKSRMVSRRETVAGNYRWGAKVDRDTIVLFGESGVGRYRLASGEWLPLVAAPPSGLFSAGMGLGADARVYAFGAGLNPGDPQRAFAFDPSGDRWLMAPMPSIARVLPHVVGGPDGHLYLIGGATIGPDGLSPRLEPTVEVFAPAG